MKILIVDDDISLIEILQYNLQEEGWEIISANGGKQALDLLKNDTPDLIILDIMMPEMDGIEVCKTLVDKYSIPIIMLSARGDVSDKVTCLNLGADDYLTKPFESEELVARIKAVMRRNQPEENKGLKYFEFGSIKIDFESRRLKVKGKESRLTQTENRLLRELIANEGKMLSYSHLLNKIWGPEYSTDREYLHVYIGHLRAKIESDPKKSKYILMQPNIGYCFKTGRKD
jgi:DNA-binding response OmpR family regulator